MKVIFLDIDGVLVTRFGGDRKHGHADADPKCVAALNRVIAATGARIVVSSTWRRGTRLIELREILNGHFGVNGGVIDKTPVISSVKKFEGKLGKIEIPAVRGDEIDAWLISYEREPVDSFVILDDDGDMGMHRQRLVQTRFESGLTDADADRAIGLLGCAVELRPGL